MQLHWDYFLGGLVFGWFVGEVIIIRYLRRRTRRIATENEKLRKFIDASECEDAHTKRGQCKMDRMAARCTICECRWRMRQA